MERGNLLSFVDDYERRGRETAFVSQRGLRNILLSYGAVAALARRFARELEGRYITKGDRVLLWSGNSPEWVAAFFGCLMRGAVVVPLDKDSTTDFATRVLKQTEARLVVCGVEERRKLPPDVPSLLLEDLEATDTLHHATDYYPEGIGEDDIAEIIYTSGTTAEPRGVVLTHRNLLANLLPLEHEIQKYLRWERLVHPVRFLNLVPLSHIFGQLMGMFVPQLLGGEVFFQESLNPSQIISRIKKNRISVAVTVPRQLDSLREKIERDHESCGQAERLHKALVAAEGRSALGRLLAFRRIHSRFGWKFWAFVTGGATLNADTETFWRRLGFVVVEGYGMTETASLISVNHPFKTGRSSIGRTLPGQEMKLGEGGEIMVRGDNVSPGYWGDQLRPATDEEGWLRTGDIGEMDEKGNLYFKGRRKDVIVTAAGLNIYPQDLEAALNRQPEVAQSTVISVEGARGPEPLAVLIMREREADPERAIAGANERLARHQRIQRWVIWPEMDFPRTATQKVRKGEVAQAVKALMSAKAGSKTQAAHPSISVLSIVERISVGKNIEQTAAPSSAANLETDLKLDSLGRVELLSALEDHYQIELDEAAFTSSTTLTDVEKIVREGFVETSVRPYPYPEWTQGFPVTWLRIAFFYSVLLPVTNLLGWTRVYGKERLSGLPGPALFVANHVSLADQSLILAALPGRFRRNMAIAMDGEMLRDWRYPPKGTGWFKRLRWSLQYLLVVALFNVFPLPQKSGFRRSFAFAGETIDRGYSLMVFPEGRRSTEERMNHFKSGIGILAAQLNVPVVPVKLGGLYELKKSGRRGFAGPNRICVTFGEAVKYALVEEPARIARDLEEKVAAL